MCRVNHHSVNNYSDLNTIRSHKGVIKPVCASNGLFTTKMPLQGPRRSMTEGNVNRCSSVTRAISLDDITLELVIRIAKHGKVHRTMYASAVGLLQNNTGCFSPLLNNDPNVLNIPNLYATFCQTCTVPLQESQQTLLLN